jgi:hypothetical protein
MRIRKEQMDILEQASLRRFEDEMVGHFRGFAPKHAQVIGEDAVRRVVRLGIGRASRYALTNRGPTRFYIEMMFMFGSEFDTDPMSSWAMSCLLDLSASDQMERADRLHAALFEYLDRVAGPKNAYSIEALRRLDRARPEDFSVSASDFDEVALRGLRDVHPQKCEFVGELAVRQVIRSGREQARAQSAEDDLGVALFIALRFTLGHGFDRDPLFPWISQTLNDPLVAEPRRRVERLHFRMKTYLSEALSYLERR